MPVNEYELTKEEQSAVRELLGNVRTFLQWPLSRMAHDLKEKESALTDMLRANPLDEIARMLIRQSETCWPIVGDSR
jgi:hypothetical protein